MTDKPIEAKMTEENDFDVATEIVTAAELTSVGQESNLICAIAEALAEERERTLRSKVVTDLAYLLSVKTGVGNDPLFGPKETFTRLMSADIEQIQKALANYTKAVGEL